MSSPARAKGPLPDPIRGRIAVVGRCASGKTNLVARLRARGYDARQCAQEHSYVGEMWQRLSRPQVLVYLDVSRKVASSRRRAPYPEEYWQEQSRRLAHARQHSHIYLHTDALTEEEVLARTVQALADLGMDPEEPRTAGGQPG